jgi:hypothetical protein
MLPHPLGVDEKRHWLPRAIAYIHEVGSIPRPLSALFPELYSLRSSVYSYRKHVVETFRLFDLARGDRSDEYVEEARRLLADTKAAEPFTGPILESYGRLEDAAYFLALHYYYHGMISWFWRLRDQLPATSQNRLARHAVEVGFYEGRSLEELGSHFAVALSVPGADRQRLWHQFAVMQVHRRAFSASISSFAKSALLLCKMPPGSERAVRMAELLNATALYYYRCGRLDKAASELSRSQRIIETIDPAYPRRQALAELLDLNRRRLERAFDQRGV